MFYISFIVIFIINKYTRTKTVKATVIDKYKNENSLKFRGALNSTQYVIVFLAEGKKLSFNVSQFSYSSYRIKEKGTLKYKGNNDY